MSNRTMLVPVTPDENTLTNHTPNEQSYSSFKDSAVAFSNSSPKSFEKLQGDVNNPLLSNAAPLFKQIVMLQSSYDVGAVENVHQTLVENINYYTEAVGRYDIENSQVMLGRYLLCTFMDEIICTTFWGKDNNWSSSSLLGHFYNETYGGEKFFQLLDKLSSAPAKYINLLELMYVCLSLGFEGKYRIQNRGKMQLDTLRDGLYKQIKMIQGREPQKFYKDQTHSKEFNKLFYKASYQILAVSLVSMLILIYGILTFSLSSKEEKTMLFLESKYKAYADENKALKTIVTPVQTADINEDVLEGVENE